jgi:hypothetical protein
MGSPAAGFPQDSKLIERETKQDYSQRILGPFDWHSLSRVNHAHQTSALPDAVGAASSGASNPLFRSVSVNSTVLQLTHA